MIHVSTTGWRLCFFSFFFLKYYLNSSSVMGSFNAVISLPNWSASIFPSNDLPRCLPLEVGHSIWFAHSSDIIHHLLSSYSMQCIVLFSMPKLSILCLGHVFFIVFQKSIVDSSLCAELFLSNNNVLIYWNLQFSKAISDLCAQIICNAPVFLSVHLTFFSIISFFDISQHHLCY